MGALPLGISPQDPCAAIVALHAERMDIPPGVEVVALVDLQPCNFSSVCSPLLACCWLGLMCR